MVKIMKKVVISVSLIIMVAITMVSCGQKVEKKENASKDVPKFKQVKVSDLMDVKKRYIKNENRKYKRKDEDFFDVDKKYIYGACTQNDLWRFYRIRIGGKGEKEYFASIPVKYDLKLQNVIKGKVYVGALFIRKDGNEGYTIYRLDPENKSKRIIFSSVNYVMPDSFICGDKIINDIMKPLKKGIMKEKILLINPDTGKTETLLSNSFKSRGVYKVDGSILLGMDFHTVCEKNGFLYSVSKFKNTTVEGKSYGNTVYYYSLKDRKSIKLFDVKNPVSCVSGNRDVLTVQSDQDDNEGASLYVKHGNGYRLLKNLEDTYSNSCEKLSKNLYLIDDGVVMRFFDIKNYRYAKMNKSFRLIGEIVKKSHVMVVEFGKDKLCFIDYIAKP